MDAITMKLKFKLAAFKKKVSELKNYDSFKTTLQYTNSYLDAIGSFNNDAFEDAANWNDERSAIVKEFIQESFALVEKLQAKGYSDGVVEVALDYISMIEENLKPFECPTAPKKKAQKDGLSALEVAIRHWYLVWGKKEAYIIPKHVGDKYKHIADPDNISKAYSKLDKKIFEWKPTNIKQLLNVRDTLNEHPNIQKAIDNHIDQLK